MNKGHSLPPTAVPLPRRSSRAWNHRDRRSTSSVFVLFFPLRPHALFHPLLVNFFFAPSVRRCHLPSARDCQPLTLLAARPLFHSPSACYPLQLDSLLPLPLASQMGVQQGQKPLPKPHTNRKEIRIWMRAEVCPSPPVLHATMGRTKAAGMSTPTW